MAGVLLLCTKNEKYFKLGVDNSIKRVYDSERQMFAREKHQDATVSEKKITEAHKIEYEAWLKFGGRRLWQS